MSDVDEVIAKSFKKEDPKSPNTTEDGRFGNSPLPSDEDIEAADKKRLAQKKAEKEAVIAEYTTLLMDANPMERAKLSLEMQERLRAIDSEGNYGTIMTSSLSSRHRELLERPFWDRNVKLRWANTRPDIRSLRKSEGYRDCLTKDGQEVRDGDAILMGMPKPLYEERFEKPRVQRREEHRKAIESEFHQTGDAEHVETFGGIKYD